MTSPHHFWGEFPHKGIFHYCTELILPQPRKRSFLWESLIPFSGGGVRSQGLVPGSVLASRFFQQTELGTVCVCVHACIWIHAYTQTFTPSRNHESTPASPILSHSLKLLLCLKQSNNSSLKGPSCSSVDNVLSGGQGWKQGGRLGAIETAQGRTDGDSVLSDSSGSHVESSYLSF